MNTGILPGWRVCIVAIGDQELWRGKNVTRGQLATFAVVTYLGFGLLVGGVAMREQSDRKQEIGKIQDQQNAAAATHQETMKSLQEIHDDLKLLTKELVQSNLDAEKPKARK